VDLFWATGDAMTQELCLSLARQALLLMVLASLPPLVASLVAGFLVSLFQAVTQLQDSTLAVVPRLAAAVGALVLCGPWIFSQLARFTEQLLWVLPRVSS